jgi:hypothetical protein
MLNKITGVLACALALTLALPVLAQEEEGPPLGVWQREVKIGLNILQSAYSENWNGGDKGSVVWTGNLDARFENQFDEGHNWRNTLKLAYGQTHNQERDAEGNLFWKRPDKTDDIIDFESLFRWTPASGWDPYVSVGFKSMFEDLNDPAGRSIWFNPKTLKGSAGMSRKFIDKEKQQFSARLGLAGIFNQRSFFTADAPSDETRSETSNELAAEAIFEYKVGALDERVDWESKLTLTQPFAYSGKSVFEDGFTSDLPLPEDVASYTTTLDVDWENTFTANITKVISVKLYIRWVYDKYDNTVTPVVEEGALVNETDVQGAIRKAGQFKQTLALGFGYTFN